MSKRAIEELDFLGTKSEKESEKSSSKNSSQGLTTTYDDSRKKSIASIPALHPISRYLSENSELTSPLTIIYKGAVAIFDVPQDSAERIIKLAEKRNQGIVGLSSSSQEAQLIKNGGQIITDTGNERKKPNQGFKERRRERLDKCLMRPVWLRRGQHKRGKKIQLDPSLDKICWVELDTPTTMGYKFQALLSTTKDSFWENLDQLQMWVPSDQENKLTT